MPIYEGSPVSWPETDTTAVFRSWPDVSGPQPRERTVTYCWSGYRTFITSNLHCRYGMETSKPKVTLNRMSAEEMSATVSGVKKMLMVGALFAAVGYVLILGALVLEITQFHPLIESFFATHTQHSLAGGGPDRAAAGLNQQLATIHSFPSTLLWLKLGGIGHILVGIFIALAGIVRALSLMPHRLSYEMNRT